MTLTPVSRMSYMVGLVTGVIMSVLLVLFLPARFSGSPDRHTVRVSESSIRRGDGADLDVPSLGLQTELRLIGAVFDNTVNVTDSVEHDNFLVRPDRRLEYVLRPNVAATAYLLRSRTAIDLDPPVLYVPSAAPVSTGLRAYLDRAARIRYDFTTNADGLRTTVPLVKSSRRVLLIGDSVAFGVGVRDGETMASYLQRSVGPKVQVINAAVGGYGARQIYEVARRHLTERRFDALIYVACLNDFDGADKAEYLENASRLLKQLAELKARFANKAVVLVQSHMEYTLRDVFGTGGWSVEELAATSYLLEGLPKVAAELGFEYIDWAQLMDRAVSEQETIFGRFAFYFDHAHFSPLGHTLAADRLLASLRALRVVS